jgi:hypothetical protein
MFEDEIDLDGFYGQPSSSALGVLVQILAADKISVTLNHLIDHFSDDATVLRTSIDELRFLGFLDVAQVYVDGNDTLELEITMPGHVYLSLFAGELINHYKCYFSE